MSVYRSAETWGAALQRLFNPEPVDPATDTVEAKDARIREGLLDLYIPGTSHVTIDGFTMDFDGLIASVNRVRRSTTNSGTFVRFTVRDYVRDPSDTTKFRCVWRIVCEDPPDGPPAKRPLPPVVEVQVRGTLSAPDGKAVDIQAQSQTISESDDSSSSDD
ncbi:uncharacterized protein SPSK_02807 [Sporothrix schenckii 1099-18]|uniref:SnoaL-like domain-containing protein n=2 Tax=Sporothrix schenckii TaxID=29908 RepID=U7PR44_SPOS1|nr:uncharacterized protein SPSK_02807 [Sporothrix schenckii 1099-18]ERS97381.1 hypothetical protein HMPREF1624_06713 [Sporothrix schenckii ATCC 58251]KJR86664.1 hypothetical protein SPSK_02807 [Sporothrix schenckii 1099-18]